MTLADWLRSTGTTQLKLAELTGIPQPELSKYARGARGPGLRNALAIERATGGAVPVESWVEEIPPAASTSQPDIAPPPLEDDEEPTAAAVMDAEVVRVRAAGIG